MSIVVNKTRLPVTEWQTASGSVVSIADARKRYAKSLSVALEPIQDLHGYDAPWVGGAGKNLAPFEDVLPDGYTKTERGITVTVHNGVVHLEGVSESQTTWNILDFQTVWNISGNISNYPISAGTYSIATGLTCRIGGQNKSGTFTITETSYIRGFYIFVSGNKYQQQINQDIVLAITAGSTIPTEWTPYENICPISGRSSVTAVRDGKNLLDYSAFQQYSYWSDSIVTYGAYPTSSGNKGYLLPVVAGMTYAVSLGISSNSFPTYCYLCRANGSDTSERLRAFTTGTFGTASFTFTAESGWIYYVRIGSSNTESLFTTQMEKVSSAQLELGSATAYEPYRGISVTLSLGQTVYDGTVDLVSGVMTVTHGCYTITGSEVWNTNANNLNRYYTIAYLLRGIAKLPVDNSSSVPIQTSIGNFNDSYYSMQNKNGKMCIAADGRIGINANLYDLYGGTDVLKDVQIVYELATPQTIQLSPNQIEMLMRNNTVWSDAGLVTLNYARIHQ